MLAVLLAALFAVPSSRAAEERTVKASTGVEISDVVAVVEGNQCLGIAASPAGTVEWGDGTGSSAASFEAAGTGTWRVLGKHAYGKPGVYRGSFSGSYKCGGSEAHFATTGFDAEVTTTIDATAGVEFSGELAGVPVENTEGTDCTGAAHEASGTITWGDGGKSALSGSEFVTEKELTLRLSGAHTYAAAGTYEGKIAGSYKCLNGTTQSYKAKFSALVTAPAPAPGTTTTTPPAAPPPVRAVFAVESVTAGRAVLNAAASVPAGGGASRYSWTVSGGAQPDVVCQGSEPELTVQTGAALSGTVTLTATDASTGAQTAFSQPIAIPAPSKPALTGKLARASSASPPRRKLPGAVSTPSFKLIGTCTGGSLPLPLGATYRGARTLGSPLTVNIGGSPPAACLEETEFGAADIEGCLGQVADISEIPGGVTLALSKLLCGAKQTDFCLPPLSALGNSALSALGARVASHGLSAREALSVPAAAGLVEKSLVGVKYPIYFSTSAIRIDGLDMDPAGGSPLVIIPAADLIVGLNVRVYLHGLPLVQLPALALRLPDLGGEIGELRLPKNVPVIGSLPFTGSIGIGLHRAGARLSNGDTCAFDCAALSVHLELPGVFTNEDGEGLSAGAVLTADDQQGLQLDSFEMNVPQADLGGIGLSKVQFRYLHGNDSFHGGATLDLGPIGDVGATIDFIHGHFNGASLEYSAGVGPGIDLGGPIPIFLTRLGGGFTLEPPEVEANGAIAGGPNVLGCSLFGIDANVVVRFEPEFALDANGTGELLCQSVASEYFHLDGGGHIGLGGTIHIHFLVFSLEGGINFDVDTAQGHFQADGNVNACLELFGEHCLGAEAVVSDRGIGVCADLGFTHAGGGIQFPDHGIIFFDTCDIGKFRSLGFVTGLRGHSTAAQGFTIPKGEKVATIGLPGAGGAPRATLTGPSGRTIATPVSGYEKTPSDVVIVDEKSETKETYFFIDHPEPGAWKVTPQPGSPAITSIQQASALPRPALKGHVSPAGRGRERLRYTLHPLAGQQVKFAEKQANGNFRVIGTARGHRGTVLFSPSAQLGKSRGIEAMVTQDGRPREDVVIARFTVAPRASLPAPGHLRLSRRRGALQISFHPVRGAAGYGIAVRLSDGRSLYVKLAAGRTRASIAAVAPTLSGKVSVGALEAGPRLRHGRLAKVQLRVGAQPQGAAVAPLRT